MKGGVEKNASNKNITNILESLTMEAVIDVGGVENLAKKLNIPMSSKGLSHSEVNYMREKNAYYNSPAKTILFNSRFCKVSTMLFIPLMFTQIFNGLCLHASMQFKIVILVAVSIFINIFLISKEIKSSQSIIEEYVEYRERVQIVSVVRDNKFQDIAIFDLVVGDLLVLQKGDVVPVDCLIVFENDSIEQYITCDETFLEHTHDCASLCDTTSRRKLVKKSKKDCFLYATSVIASTSERLVKAMAISDGDICNRSDSANSKVRYTSELTMLTSLGFKIYDIFLMVRYLTLWYIAVFVVFSTCLLLSRFHFLGDDHPFEYIMQCAQCVIVSNYISDMTNYNIFWSITPNNNNNNNNNRKDRKHNSTNLIVQSVYAMFLSNSSFTDCVCINSFEKFEQLVRLSDVCLNHGTLYGVVGRDRRQILLSEMWVCGDIYKLSYKYNDQSNIRLCQTHDFSELPIALKEMIAENIALNCNYGINEISEYKSNTNNNNSKKLDISFSGNFIEESLLSMIASWGFEHEKIVYRMLTSDKYTHFPYDQQKNKSTTVVHKEDGTVRIYVKGASRVILPDCLYFSVFSGGMKRLSKEHVTELLAYTDRLKKQGYKPVCFAYKDYPSASNLPVNWRDAPPDNANLCCCGIVSLDAVEEIINENVIQQIIDLNNNDIKLRFLSADTLEYCHEVIKINKMPKSIIVDASELFRLIKYAIGEYRNKIQLYNIVGGIASRIDMLACCNIHDKIMFLRCLRRDIDIAGYLNEVAAKDSKNMIIDGEPNGIDPEERAEGTNGSNHNGMEGYAQDSTRRFVGFIGYSYEDFPVLQAADISISVLQTGMKNITTRYSDVIIIDGDIEDINVVMKWSQLIQDVILISTQYVVHINIVSLTVVILSILSGQGLPISVPLLLLINGISVVFVPKVMYEKFSTDKVKDLPALNRKDADTKVQKCVMALVMNALCHAIVLMFVVWFGYKRFQADYGTSYCSQYSQSEEFNFLYKVFFKNDKSMFAWNINTGTRMLTTNAGYDKDMATFITCKDFASFCPDLDGLCYRADHIVTTREDFEVHFQFEDFSGFDVYCDMKCTQYSYQFNSIVYNIYFFMQLFSILMVKFSRKTYKMYIYVIVFMAVHGMIVTYGNNYFSLSPLTTHQWISTIVFSFIACPIHIIVHYVTLPMLLKVFHIIWYCFHGLCYTSGSIYVDNIVYNPLSQESIHDKETENYEFDDSRSFSNRKDASRDIEM